MIFHLLIIIVSSLTRYNARRALKWQDAPALTPSLRELVCFRSSITGVLTISTGVKIIRLHNARYTHASLMLQQNIPLKVVSERLGHASTSITADTYSHIAPGMQEAAARGFDVAVNKRLATV